MATDGPAPSRRRAISDHGFSCSVYHISWKSAGVLPNFYQDIIKNRRHSKMLSAFQQSRRAYVLSQMKGLPPPQPQSFHRYWWSLSSSTHGSPPLPFGSPPFQSVCEGEITWPPNRKSEVPVCVWWPIHQFPITISVHGNEQYSPVGRTWKTKTKNTPSPPPVSCTWKRTISSKLAVLENEQYPHPQSAKQPWRSSDIQL